MFDSSHWFAASDLLGECRGEGFNSQDKPPLECFTKCKSLKDSDKLIFLLPTTQLMNTKF